MKVFIRHSKQKGVALAFALMTALLLMTLSTTVVGLSMRHARSGSDVDYAQQALNASNWYVSATLDYLKSPGALVTNQKYGFPNPYTDTTSLVEYGPGSTQTALGNPDVHPYVTRIKDREVAENYGLDPSNTSNAYLLRFLSTSADGSPLVFFPTNGEKQGAGWDPNSDSFAICDIAIEKVPPHSGPYGTSAQPGYYHLCVFTRIYSSDMLSTIRTLQANKPQGFDAYPSEGLLATRVIEVKARTEGPMDYLHIIQDGRSWRAQGLNLDGRNNSLFEQYQNGNDKALQNGLLNCGFPDGYSENGRMRIDGGTRMSKARNNTVIDGAAQFFGGANFSSEFTQQRGMKDINKGTNSDLSSVFTGGLNDGQDPIGLPQNGENSSFDKNGNFIYKSYSDRKTYQSFSRDMAKESSASGTSCNFSINGDIGSSDVKVNTTPGKNIVPDVYGKSYEKFVDGQYPEDMDIRPTFAKIVVELDEGDKLQVYKVNPALPKNSDGTDRKQVLYTGSSKGIKNGIISVQGGNVEVCSKFNNGKAAEFTGDITIVSDVNADREDSLAYYNDSKGKSYKNGKSIYSDSARAYYDEHPNEPPPYKVSKLLSEYKGKEKCITSSNSNAYVWPTPTSEAVEREGNVYVTSDIACGSEKGKRGTVGIVAKNYVSLNDKTVNKKGSNPSKQTLNIEAMLFSFDKSVQFDWTNDAGNANFNTLKQNAQKRQFNLTGCVVSSNIDVEGSAEGMGYLLQNERNNVSATNAPPLTPAYAEGEGRWVIVSYVDRGSRNWF